MAVCAVTGCGSVNDRPRGTFHFTVPVYLLICRMHHMLRAPTSVSLPKWKIRVPFSLGMQTNVRCRHSSKWPPNKPVYFVQLLSMFTFANSATVSLQFWVPLNRLYFCCPRFFFLFVFAVFLFNNSDSAIPILNGFRHARSSHPNQLLPLLEPCDWTKVSSWFFPYRTTCVRHFNGFIWTVNFEKLGSR